MANFTQFVKRKFKVDISTIFHDARSKKDPNEFKPNGSQIYHGYQGEGKTVSMVYHAFKLKDRYPKALLISNLVLNNYEALKVRSLEELNVVLQDIDTEKQYLHFNDYNELILLLRYARRGKYGAIFMIDEIHNYFHSHDSKSMPMWIVQVFSQQRKQRLVILGTVQDWDDVIKAIRRQIDNLIACSKFGYFIRQTVVDPRTIENQYGERTAVVRKKGMFFLTKRLRDSFDTHQVINSGREIMGGESLSVEVNQLGDKPKPRISRSRRVQVR